MEPTILTVITLSKQRWDDDEVRIRSMSGPMDGSTPPVEADVYRGASAKEAAEVSSDAVLEAVALGHLVFVLKDDGSIGAVGVDGLLLADADGTPDNAMPVNVTGEEVTEERVALLHKAILVAGVYTQAIAQREGVREERITKAAETLVEEVEEFLSGPETGGYL
jgi:hypothetical protein